MEDNAYNFYINKISKKDFNNIFGAQIEDLRDNYEDEKNGISDYDKYITWDYKEQVNFIIPFLISYGWTNEELIKKGKVFRIMEDNDFIVNDFLTINNFELINGDIVQFRKFGVMYDYKEFKGLVGGKKVKGFVCLADDNIYKMEYLEE